MDIPVNEQILLSAHTISDVSQLAERIGHKSVADFTLTIPFPYSVDDAEMFINQAMVQNQGSNQRNWAIRHQTEGLIGGIGIHYKFGPKSHKDEIGYWLTPDFWGNGIMTEVVGVFVDKMVEMRNLKRIEAPVYTSNSRSSKVLVKNGFLKEGVMQNAYHKNGSYYDAALYAKTF